MRRWVAAGLVVAVGLAAGWWWWLRPIEFPAPVAVAAGTTVTHADFVGAEACGACHRGRYEAWQGSTHGTAGGPPNRETVIAPFDGTPIRFADATVIPSIGGDGAYRFTVRRRGREPEAFTVAGVIGRGHMVGGGTQGFVADFPDGTVRFLPFDFIRREDVWFCNTNSRTNRGWVPITPQMTLAECADWPPTRVLGTDKRYANCQECHGSQVQVAFDTAALRYRTEFTSLRINCESCHGPGRRHVEIAQSGGLRQTSDIGMPSLMTLEKDASLAVCFRCHALKDVLRTGYLPGEPLEDYYTLGLPVLGDKPLFPDGRVRTFAYQGNHRYSDCYLNGSMTCTDCHDPHSQGYRDVSGSPLESRFSDGQCTGCHASKAERGTDHTRHAAVSAGSRCVACHMPYLQHPELGDALRFARSDHTIAIPRPAFDARLGIVSACAQCHSGVAVDSLEAATRHWWGRLKPHDAIVDALAQETFTTFEQATGRLLDPDARHPMAQISALYRLGERYLRPDMRDAPPILERRLRALAAADDLDLRAVALAALHLVRGHDRSTRRFLVRALRDAGDDTQRLRVRWATAVATFGDVYAARGDPRAAIAAYRKALEVEPNEPAVLRNLGVALQSTGDVPAAVETLRHATEGDPYDPDAWLNLGVARERQGNPAGAEAAYRRSVRLKPDATLAHANLGNVLLRRNANAEALEHYELAVGLDPLRVDLRLVMAVTLGRLGQLERALAAAHEARRMAPQDPRVARVVEDLEAAVRRLPLDTVGAPGVR
jgi:tetratricopeptide (TPR) repeat protein